MLYNKVKDRKATGKLSSESIPVAFLFICFVFADISFPGNRDVVLLKSAVFRQIE